MQWKVGKGASQRPAGLRPSIMSVTANQLRHPATFRLTGGLGLCSDQGFRLFIKVKRDLRHGYLPLKDMESQNPNQVYVHLYCWAIYQGVSIVTARNATAPSLGAGFTDTGH